MPFKRLSVSPEAAKGPTALVVEDDPHLQIAMGRQLARLNFFVLSASHYDGAIRHLTEREAHVVCIDVGLPNKSGYELCEHIRRSLGLLDLQVLMTSEYGGPQERAYAEDAGASAFLRKPFTMAQFAQCIESLSLGIHRRMPSAREPSGHASPIAFARSM